MNHDTPEHREILAKVKDFTQRIQDLIAERKEFMDAAMPLFSKFQVGDTIYDREGRNLGIVTELYRYHADQNPLYDTGMSVDCRYRVNGSTNSYGNTSRQFGAMNFCTKDDLRGIAARLALVADGLP